MLDSPTVFYRETCSIAERAALNLMHLAQHARERAKDMRAEARDYAADAVKMNDAIKLMQRYNINLDFDDAFGMRDTLDRLACKTRKLAREVDREAKQHIKEALILSE